MKITERKLRKIIRQTIISEQNSIVINEGLQQMTLPLMMFVLTSLSACTGKPIEPVNNNVSETMEQEISTAPRESMEEFEREMKIKIEKLRRDGKNDQADDLEEMLNGLLKVRRLRIGVESRF